MKPNPTGKQLLNNENDMSNYRIQIVLVIHGRIKLVKICIVLGVGSVNVLLWRARFFIRVFKDASKIKSVTCTSGFDYPITCHRI